MEIQFVHELLLSSLAGKTPLKTWEGFTVKDCSWVRHSGTRHPPKPSFTLPAPFNETNIKHMKQFSTLLEHQTDQILTRVCTMCGL